MAHTVRDMDKKVHEKNTIFNRLNPHSKHLKPLSVSSRMITCDQKTSLPHPGQRSNPFINFKIEVVNNCVKKRKLDYSCPDDGYETPAKKALGPKALSPDLGCFMDYCSPLVKQDALSPFAYSVPALFDEGRAATRSEIKETVSSRLHLEHMKCGPLTDPEGNKGTVPHSLKSEKVLLNFLTSFDCDVDDILCLNPVGPSAAGGFSANVESSKRPSSNMFQHGQELERGHEHVEEERGELKKEMCLSVKDVEEDKGYFSISYIKDLELGKNSPRPVYSLLPPVTSSPLLRIGVVKGPEDEYHPESSSAPGCHKQAVLSGQHGSFSDSNLSPIVSRPLFASESSPVDLLEGNEEVCNIGPPMFESSICHSVTVKLNAGSEQSRQVSEEVQGGIIEPIHEYQDSRGGGESTLDTSYETTSLQVQVKSVVVAIGQHTSSKPAAPPLPDHNANPTKPSPNENAGYQSAKCVRTARSQRPVVFDRKMDWEREKRLYVHSVTRHMNENSGVAEDAMSELLKLMSHVADQTPGTSGKQWQHPSDATRRNYQRRFGNMIPKMTLKEWQAKNCTTHKRFAKVPKIFERSPFP